MGENATRDLMKSYLDKMTKVTPVYIVGLMLAVEPALYGLSGSNLSQQLAAIGIVLVFGIIALFVFEGVGRQLGTSRKLQIFLVSVTSCIYLIFGSWIAMGQSVTAFPLFGPLVPVFLAGWVFLAPLLLYRYEEEESGTSSSTGTG